MFHGSMVALVTPMKSDGSIDYESLSKLLAWHIDNLTDAIVILGTTGESPTIEFSEREKIIGHALKEVAGRIPVIAGTGSNSTTEAIHLTRHAMELGVDGCLVVTPYYNKPTQHGLYEHFKAIAENVAVPQILYNVPSRTGCDMQPDTVARLAAIPNIVAIKEASGDLSRVPKILDLCGDTLDLLSGDDINAFEFMLAGGKGVISVTANIAPRLVHDMCTAILNANVEKAREINQKLMLLNRQLTVETNPIPVKWALHEMDMVSAKIRLPLTPLSQEKRPQLLQMLKETRII